MTEQPSYHEKELLQEISTGNQEAFAQIFDQHFHRIFYMVLTYTKSNVVAEEIVQDIFLKVWRNRQQLEEVHSFKDYLFILARNHVISAMRLRINKPVKNLGLELAENLPGADQYSDHDIEKILLAGIESLPPQQKAVITLRKNENLSYKEIGERLGISPNTVKYHLTTALSFLRSYVAARDIPIVLLILSKPYLQHCSIFF